MKKRFLVLFALALVLSANLCAQVTIGGLTTPKAGALLDLNSTTTGGLVLSNVDLSDLSVIPGGVFVNIPTTQDRNQELAGMIVYNTYAANGVGVHVWDGDDWIKLCAPPAPGPITFSKTKICGSGSTFTAKIDSVKGATSYVWSLPAGLTGTSNDTIITITAETVENYLAGSITVRAVSSCGAGTRRASTQAIVINALPAVPTNPSSNSGNKGSSIVFSASVPTGHVIDWYDAPIGGIKITSSNSFSKTLTTTTTYYAESRNTTTGCVSATRLAVTGSVIFAAGCDPLPATPLITSLNVAFATGNGDVVHEYNGVTVSAPVKIVGKGSKTSLSSTSNSLVDYRDHTSDANTNYYGSLFTWCMVVGYADILCPSPWKVPTNADFERYAIDRYIVYLPSNHGWLAGNYAYGNIFHITSCGYYWSSTPHGTDEGYNMEAVSPGGGGALYSDWRPRHYGLSLRCVR